MIKKTQRLLIPAGALFLAALLTTSCTTNNWPQFRGPEQNMVAKAKNLPGEWGEGDHIRWTAEISGASWASPVVWGNKVFITAVRPVKVAPPPERQDGNPPPGEEEPGFLNDIYSWEVNCFDIETGKVLWTQVAREGNPKIKKHSAHNYAGETPVTDGERLYVYFGMTGVYCYDLDGLLLWEKELEAYETLNGWGTGASPVVFEGLLYIQADNEEHSYLVALDAATGDEVWRADRDEKTNYSTPFIWKNSVRTELVTGGKKARSYDLLTGDIYWELDMPGYYNIPSPVADKNFLYLGNTAWRDTPGSMFCVKAGAEGNISPAEGATTSNGVAWSIQDSPLDRPSPILSGGLLYMVSSQGGVVTCIEAVTGDQVYQEKIEGVAACWASPWLYADKVYFTDEKGVTRIIRAGREFELLDENSLDDKFWASVAVTKDAWLMKGVAKMYCIGD